jgi:solute carrier family 26 protein
MQVIMNAVPIAIVAFTIGQGLGKIFSAKYGLQLHPSQELRAQGAANLFGSFFHCLPMAASLARSMVQETTGCRYF